MPLSIKHSPLRSQAHECEVQNKIGGQRGHWEDKMPQGKAGDVTRAQVRVQGTTQATEVHLLRRCPEAGLKRKTEQPRKDSDEQR